jgi:hypothetical protein
VRRRVGNDQNLTPPIAACVRAYNNDFQCNTCRRRAVFKLARHPANSLISVIVAIVCQKTGEAADTAMRMNGWMDGCARFVSLTQCVCVCARRRSN